MRISPITNNYAYKFNNSNIKNKQNTTQRNTQSFKSIFIDSAVDLGKVALKTNKSDFLPKDALMLNEIANQYPYQDCFIQRGFHGYPKLAFREKPPSVEKYINNPLNIYEIMLSPYDKQYPIVPLLLYDDVSSIMIGLPSYKSKNPSLSYTVQAGYELHKKLIEKKNEILKMIGKADDYSYDIGEDSVMDRAKKEIEPIEKAVQRLLLEEAYVALSDAATSQQIYESDMPKYQSRLDAKRKLDLTTSNAKLPNINAQDLGLVKKDICEIAINRYPNMEENKNRIDELKEYMFHNGLNLVVG